MKWRLGYHLAATTRGIIPNGFGHFGFGGSGAWADPDNDLAVALRLQPRRRHAVRRHALPPHRRASARRGDSPANAPAYARPVLAAVGPAREAPGLAVVHGIVGGPGPTAELGGAVVGERLLDLGLVVHHERSVLRDRLADRATLQHERFRAVRDRR